MPKILTPATFFGFPLNAPEGLRATHAFARIITCDIQIIKTILIYYHINTHDKIDVINEYVLCPNT